MKKFCAGLALALVLCASVACAYTYRYVFSHQSTGNYSAVNSSPIAVWDGDAASIQVTEHNNVTTALNVYGSNDGLTWWFVESLGTAKANSTLTEFTPPALNVLKVQANASGGIGNITAVFVTR